MISELITSAKVTYLDSAEAGRLAILTLDNGADHRKPNTFGERGLACLRAAVEEVGALSDVKGVLLTGKPFVFAAGADLGAFEGMDEAGAREAARRGHEVFGRLRDLPCPSLAAVNGVCIGGGLELALSCDYRTLSASAAGVAFPEVFLSIVPAWGGTQLAPRVAGFGNALTVIVGNPLNTTGCCAPHRRHSWGWPTACCRRPTSSKRPWQRWKAWSRGGCRCRLASPVLKQRQR